MKSKLLMTGIFIALAPNILLAFCGFYVSKADGTLKNKTSQVILVRDGNKTVITMYNDFQGNPKDFAMVVPVPVVLRKDDIHVVDQNIFKSLNDYSAPRLVEYWDRNPCQAVTEDEVVVSAFGVQRNKKELGFSSSKMEDHGVKIEAKYLVGEYDILILSAKESGGLKEWLITNGYKIPEGAEEVLDPYIKSNLKFFVVKVNEAEKKKLPGNFLRPLQIGFSSPKFMLPIRLGMANSDGDQDMIVYAFTRKGRIECTNYRTVNIPTDRNIPLFVQKNFSAFYNNLFDRQWRNEDKSVAFLEYAWDVSPMNYYHCDPCIATAPTQQELVTSGVWWLSGKDWSDYSDVDNDEPDNGSKNVHFTRLHIRYNRKSFPQDLMFQVTPNTETFQAKYVITHPATGDCSCAAGKDYLKELRKRRKKELMELTELTGRSLYDWQDDVSLSNEETSDKNATYATLLPEANRDASRGGGFPTGIVLMSVALIGGAGVMRWKGYI